MSKHKRGGTPQKVKNQGLVMMNFQVPQALYLQFKAKAVQDRLSIRSIAEAFLTAYVRGEFSLVEEKKEARSKKS